MFIVFCCFIFDKYDMEKKLRINNVTIRAKQARSTLKKGLQKARLI